MKVFFLDSEFAVAFSFNTSSLTNLLQEPGKCSFREGFSRKPYIRIEECVSPILIEQVGRGFVCSFNKETQQLHWTAGGINSIHTFVCVTVCFCKPSLVIFLHCFVFQGGEGTCVISFKLETVDFELMVEF
jgi:hypothetical protein